MGDACWSCYCASSWQLVCNACCVLRSWRSAGSGRGAVLESLVHVGVGDHQGWVLLMDPCHWSSICPAWEDCSWVEAKLTWSLCLWSRRRFPETLGRSFKRSAETTCTWLPAGDEGVIGALSVLHPEMEGRDGPRGSAGFAVYVQPCAHERHGLRAKRARWTCVPSDNFVVLQHGREQCLPEPYSSGSCVPGCDAQSESAPRWGHSCWKAGWAQVRMQAGVLSRDSRWRANVYGCASWPSKAAPVKTPCLREPPVLSC